VRTNAAFLARCLDDPDFIAGRIDTGFIEQRLAALTADPDETPPHVIAAAAGERAFFERAAGDTPWGGALFGFRLNGPAGTELALSHDGRTQEVILSAYEDGTWSAEVDAWSFPMARVEGGRWRVGDLEVSAITADERTVAFDDGAAFEFIALGNADAAPDAFGDDAVRSPMPGKVAAVFAAVGEAVTRGQPLVTLEAMKMEHALTAPFDGTLAELNVKVGDQVAEGMVLARLEAAA
jgi:propionyl-CoA carboxylase alpha chain/3-methylcrotonyl-CoA carboxylase alpha subunit